MDTKQLVTDLAIAASMTEELADYLMGDSLYRQMVVKTPLGMRQPKMTLGALLETLQELGWRRDQLTAGQREELAAIEERVDIARNAFADQWRSFLQRELKALMDSWKWYLGDVARDPDARERYSSEVRVRTRIDLVMRALSGDVQLAAEKKNLGELDAQLKGVWDKGSYVGPEGEQTHYPSGEAWWLYGQPAGDD